MEECRYIIFTFLHGSNYISPQSPSSISISIYLSLFLSLSLYLYISMSLLLYLSISISLHLSRSLSLSLSVSVYLSPSLSLFLYISLSLPLSPSLSVRLCISLPPYLAFSPSLTPSLWRRITTIHGVLQVCQTVLTYGTSGSYSWTASKGCVSALACSNAADLNSERCRNSAAPECTYCCTSQYCNFESEMISLCEYAYSSLIISAVMQV